MSVDSPDPVFSHEDRGVCIEYKIATNAGDLCGNLLEQLKMPLCFLEYSGSGRSECSVEERPSISD